MLPETPAYSPNKIHLAEVMDKFIIISRITETKGSGRLIILHS